MIKALRIFTISSNLSRMSFYSTSERILFMRLQNRSLISSQFSINFRSTLGFCPGAGLIFSGTLAIPSKSLQFVRSMRTANIYGRKSRIELHRVNSSIMIMTLCSRLYSLLSLKHLRTYLSTKWVTSSNCWEVSWWVVTTLRISSRACLRVEVAVSLRLLMLRLSVLKRS